MWHLQRPVVSVTVSASRPPCRHCEQLDSASNHLESPASIVHSGTRATPCHVPRACLHISGHAVECPRWTSPQLKQAAAASRSLSRPELTRKAEALNPSVDPYLPAPYEPKPFPQVKLHLLASQVLPAAKSRFRLLELPSLQDEPANRLRQPVANSICTSSPCRSCPFSPTGSQFIPNSAPLPWTACLQNSWPPACPSFRPERLPCRLKRTHSVGPCPSGFPPNIAPALHFKE